MMQSEETTDIENSWLKPEGGSYRLYSAVPRMESKAKGDPMENLLESTFQQKARPNLQTFFENSVSLNPSTRISLRWSTGVVIIHNLRMQ
jgi:hypothetical protein